jgi:hypothetical protein
MLKIEIKVATCGSDDTKRKVLNIPREKMQ